MSDTAQLNAVLVETDPERAKKTIAGLNRVDLDIKCKIVISPETLDETLAQQAWDIILVNDGLESPLQVEQVSAELKQKSLATPMLVVGDSVDDIVRCNALKSGARDAVSLESTALLGLVIQRETCAQIEPLQEAKVEPAPVPTAATSGTVSGSKILSNEQQQWHDRIKAALENDRFLTVFQPIVNLAAEPAEQYEVLIRMLDENGQEIAPAAFINAAEESGLMADIDRWVISRAIQIVQERQTEGKPTRLFIKISNNSLCDPTLWLWVSEQLIGVKLPRNSLVFEITEADAVASNMESTQKLITTFKRLNCLVALDHAGMNGVDKMLWRNLDLDYIKIAGQLIRSLPDEKRDLVKEIVSQAKENNILCIAQSVQDANVLAFLWQQGVNYIQGYFLQSPASGFQYDFSQDSEEAV